MRKPILVFLVVSLASCGHSPAGVSGLSAWAASDQDSFMAGCLATAINGGANGNQASTYCECVLDVVMTRYSAADFNANSTADSTAVFNDGSTVSSCRTKAGL